jgi:plastocyanin
MGSTTFAQSVAMIHRGDRLTLANNSRLVHVIGPGQGGHVDDTAAGVPVMGYNLMQTNSVYTSAPWETPGSYHLTCSVHPGMTLKVVVAP